jgi:hypothetical protein
MEDKKSTPPTARRRNRMRLEAWNVSDAVGQIAHEVGIVEALANAASTVADNVKDDRDCRRRPRDLAVQVECAARGAPATALDLDAQINGRNESGRTQRKADR